MKTVILISGYRRSGKDHLVKHGAKDFAVFRSKTATCANLDDIKGYHHIKFATPLKRMVLDFFEIGEDQYDEFKDVPLKNIGFPYNGTLRDYLIGIASSTRDVDPEFYVKKAYHEMTKSQDNFIISDWRYMNEFEYLSENHAGIKIVRVRIIRLHNEDRSLFDTPDENIISENDLSGCPVDFVLIPNFEKDLIGHDNQGDWELL